MPLTAVTETNTPIASGDRCARSAPKRTTYGPATESATPSSRTATNNRGSGRPRPISASRSTTSPVPRHWCRYRCPTEAVHAEGVGGGGDPAVIGPARRSARRPPPPPARSADCGHSTGHAASHHTRSRRAGVVLWASEIGHLDDTGRTHWADILITRVNAARILTPWRRSKIDPLHVVWSSFVGGGRGDAAEVAVFEPVGVAFESDDFGVMDEPVDHGSGDDVVAEGLAPAAERLV
jgi:hypothetical protein